MLIEWGRKNKEKIFMRNPSKMPNLMNREGVGVEYNGP
jgi:hypothetical protein